MGTLDRGNIKSDALELPANEIVVLFPGGINVQYVAAQVLEDTKKVHFWIGQVPDETYDPTVVPLLRGPKILLPVYPSEWTVGQVTHAKTLINDYGIEFEKRNIMTSLELAPIGPMYAYATQATKVNFLSS